MEIHLFTHALWLIISIESLKLFHWIFNLYSVEKTRFKYKVDENARLTIFNIFIKSCIINQICSWKKAQYKNTVTNSIYELWELFYASMKISKLEDSKYKIGEKINDNKYEKVLNCLKVMNCFWTN